MTDVKWIKLVTEFFDDEKIKLIESMPDADMILIIWIKLLTLAGKKNMNGYIFLTENIPYTDEMLSTLFNRPINTIRLALETFRNFGMIDYNGKGEIQIINWEKHQNVEGLEHIRELNRIRQEKFREKHKQIPPPNNPPIKREEKDKIRLDKIRAKNVTITLCNNIIEYLNKKTGKSYKLTTIAYQRLINARLKEGFKIDDFKKVIDNKVDEWLGNVTKDGQNMENYLRPQTLFGNKFESYLNQKKHNRIKTIKQLAQEDQFNWGDDDKNE